MVATINEAHDASSQGAFNTPLFLLFIKLSSLNAPRNYGTLAQGPFYHQQQDNFQKQDPKAEYYIIIYVCIVATYPCVCECGE